MKERGNWYLKRILRGGRREVPGGQWWLGETEIFYILQNKGMFVWESSPGECHETMSPASSWGLVSQILLWFSLQAQLWEVFSKFSWMTERQRSTLLGNAWEWQLGAMCLMDLSKKFSGVLEEDVPSPDTQSIRNHKHSEKIASIFLIFLSVCFPGHIVPWAHDEVW